MRVSGNLGKNGGEKERGEEGMKGEEKGKRKGGRG